MSLTVDERQSITSLLHRLNRIPDGETVVANIHRSLIARIVTSALATSVLKAWVERVRDTEAAAEAANAGTISDATLLKCTESELMTMTAAKPSSLWEALTDPLRGAFQPAPDETMSNVKDLSAVLRHLFGMRNLQDRHHPSVRFPIPLSDSTRPSIMAKQKILIQDALDDSAQRLKADARIHRGHWFWVTRRAAIETVMSTFGKSGRSGGRFRGDRAAERVVDSLGLVHFSRDIQPHQVEKRYVVEVRLKPGFVTRCAKPSFIFSDHNPRFGAWTDRAARREPMWGNAADLGHFHHKAKLRKGDVELVAMTPDTLTPEHIEGFGVLGYLYVNRWGPDRNVAEGTAVFADRLRFQRTKDRVLRLVMRRLP